MRTLTTAELHAWSKTNGVPLDAHGIPVSTANDRLRFEIPKQTERLAWFSNFLEALLRPRRQCLLWVTGWGVWESAENWHLYYRLRQSYGDFRLLEEAPGHLFLSYEQHDLASFLQLGLTSGWDLFLLPVNGYGRAFVSHDGWVELEAAEPGERERLNNEAVSAGLAQLTKAR
jgi:hypothetical protein